MFGFPLIEFILLVLGFGFLIFVHELGHFAIAKWVGIRCPQFAIGFGKAMVSWRKGIGFRAGSTEAEYERRCVEKLKADGVKPESAGPHTGTARYDDIEVKEEHDNAYTGRQLFKAGDALGLGETEYRLNYLPLGGYVKMLGQEDMDPNAQSDDPRAYNNKPIWARACVISAGVVMNLIFGALFLMAAFTMGVSFQSATVGYVIPGMPAATAYAEGHDGDLRYLGLREGDVVRSVNGKTPEDFKDVVIATALGSSSKDVEIVVQRRGVDQPLTYLLRPERQKTGERLLSVGFNSGYNLSVGYIKDAEGPIYDWFDERLKALPEKERGADQGFRIAAAGGQPVEDYSGYLAAFDRSGGRPVPVTFEDATAADKPFTAEVAALPTFVNYPDKPANLLGMVPAGRLAFVAEKSPAEKAGLKVGDVLVRVGGTNWPSDTPEIAQTIEQNPDKPLKIVVLRDGKRVDIGEVTPDKDNKLGIAIEPDFGGTRIARLADGTPAQAMAGGAAFMPGTELKQINDTPVSNWTDVQRLLLDLASNDGRPQTLTLTYTVPTPNASPESVEVKPTDKDYDDLLAAGWRPDHRAYQPLPEMVMLKADGPADAFMIGVDKSRDFILQTYITLLRLIQGDVKLYNLRGPVGIVSTGTQVAQQGTPYLLFFLGLISINLAVINFLPIPIVDGGHMVFLAWEKISGKPPSVKVQTAALYAGLAIIGFVFVATFYFDVMREISRFF